MEDKENKSIIFWRDKFPIMAIIFGVTLVLGIICTGLIDNTKTFEDVCIKENGSFGEIQNVTCSVGYQHCALICWIGNNIIDYYEREILYKMESTE